MIQKKEMDRVVLAVLALGLIMSGCASSPALMNRVKNFPTEGVEKFQLFIDKDTAITHIDGKPLGLSDKDGMYITLPAGEHTLTVNWRHWTGGNSVTGRYGYTFYSGIDIRQNFLPDKIYDLWLEAGEEDSVTYQFKFQKGEVPWVSPEEDERELVFMKGKEAYFVYFDKNTDYSLLVEKEKALRLFVPKDTQTVYVCNSQGRGINLAYFSRAFASKPEHDDNDTSEILTLPSEGNLLKFKVKPSSGFLGLGSNPTITLIK